MRKIKSLLYILPVILLLAACQKNKLTDVVAEPTYNDAETVTASVEGIVVNENNVPVAGASVQLGSLTVSTNFYGKFRFGHIPVSKNNGYVRVIKAGYFNGNRTFVTTAGRTHILRIKLLPKTITGTVSGSAGGTVSLSTGGKVTLPANAVTDASGLAYTGTVNVAMTWIDPAASDLASTMQGDLRGITTAGTERVLATYGMLGVELSSAAGQPLKIANGKTAVITVPIPASLQASAPATIPLWHFDETKGRWMQEGTATKTSTNYVGTVSHFSFWNCDAPFRGVNLCVHAQNQNNQPLAGITILIRRANNPASVSNGITDSLGNVCGKVPMNEALTLEVLSQCGTVLYTQSIGPFSVDASVTVTANVVAMTLTGRIVNCSNVPVTSGTAIINTSGGYFYNVPTNSSGVFTLVIPYCNTASYSLIPVDNNTMQQGALVTGTATGGIVNLGNLPACGANAQEYIHLLIDGMPFDWTVPADTVLGEGLALAPGSPYPAGNLVRGYRSQSTNQGGGIQGARLDFYHNNTAGTYPIVGVGLFIPYTAFALFSQQIVTPNPQVNITAMGVPVTGFIEGNYNIVMAFSLNNVITNRNVVCDFRVRRAQ